MTAEDRDLGRFIASEVFKLATSANLLLTATKKSDYDRDAEAMRKASERTLNLVRAFLESAETSDPLENVRILYQSDRALQEIATRKRKCRKR